jgi:hypothetical protein
MKAGFCGGGGRFNGPACGAGGGGDTGTTVCYGAFETARDGKCGGGGGGTCHGPFLLPICPVTGALRILSLLAGAGAAPKAPCRCPQRC